ncbi:uncharacterized protein BX664DRAFT_381282 [Halteromyces radiatus]|uniref:uncharacterized protein n=1 Tax=Halteromyces radiatus TaxID=101107 RepID=UPI002220AA4F|nr:uncharacterized protein BX664DRAFT_381282 [Halteromyces radiatus]KAI8098587.1 hypothetical protein BX664DRAFT_381282 [Halteromyces radiatus]
MYSMKQRKSIHCFLMLLLSFPRLSWGSRQTNCGQNGNTDTICSPLTGDTWQQNGTYYLVTWNPTYPTYVSAASLSIYIYYVEHYEKINIISFHNISNIGEYPILINNTWFNSNLGLKDFPNHDARLYLLASGMNPITEMNNLNSAWPQPVHFSVLESSSDPHASSSTNSQSPISTSMGTPPWVTPLIVIGCILLVIGCIAAFWMMRLVRRRKLVYGEKSHLDQISSKNSTVYPTQPPPSSGTIFKHQDNDQHTTVSSSYPDLSSVTPPPPTLQSMSNLSSRSDPPLTSTDALLIADTFRQRMRRPEWPHCSNIVQPSQEEQEQENTDNWKEDDDEIQRRLASELLLKKELEAEGTLMKKVGKRAHLLSTIEYDSSFSSTT